MRQLLHLVFILGHTIRLCLQLLCHLVANVRTSCFIVTTVEFTGHLAHRETYSFECVHAMRETMKLYSQCVLFCLNHQTTSPIGLLESIRNTLYYITYSYRTFVISCSNLIPHNCSSFVYELIKPVWQHVMAETQSRLIQIFIHSQGFVICLTLQ